MGVVIGHRDLAAPDPPGQLCPLLDDQRVRGHMVRPRTDRRVQRGPPVVVGLPGRPVDQIEVDVLEARLPRLGDTRLGPPRRMRAVQDLQHMLPRALHPERDPVEAALPQLGQIRRIDGFRVGLGGDLGIVREPELVADRPQHPYQVSGGQQGRRAAADEDRTDRTRIVTEDLAGLADLADQMGCVVVPGGQRTAGTAQFGGGVGVEVAVPAAGRAVGHMQVEAERPVGGAFQGMAGQRPVVGYGFTIGQYGRHTAHCHSPPRTSEPRS